MIVWLAPPLVYLAIGAWFWRSFAWRLAFREASTWSHPQYIDGGNVAFGIIFGGLQASVWPVTLFIRRGARTEGFYGFLREPRDMRMRRELRERQEHIDRLERELNIR